jgi:hypothetical protein
MNGSGAAYRAYVERVSGAREDAPPTSFPELLLARSNPGAVPVRSRPVALIGRANHREVLCHKLPQSHRPKLLRLPIRWHLTCASCCSYRNPASGAVATIAVVPRMPMPGMVSTHQLISFLRRKGPDMVRILDLESLTARNMAQVSQVS